MAKALKHNIEIKSFITLPHDYLVFHKNSRVQLLRNAHNFDLILDVLENSKLRDGLKIVIMDETVLKRRIQSLDKLFELRPALNVLTKVNQEISDAFFNLIWEHMNVH